MTTFDIHTLGCKVNFYESEWIRERLRKAGLLPVKTPDSCPDWVIINTCTVTSKADRQSRQLIYQTARQCPDTKIVVTGCYAERDPESLNILPNVVQVIPNREKQTLPFFLHPTSSLASDEMVISTFQGHVRAYLMVQNGCNARCAYCIIPRVRGKSRSKPVKTILRELEGLFNSGHPEIVLCGIHLGCYGRDLTPPETLHSLLQAIEPRSAKGRIRISSIEPMELNEEIIQTVAGSNRFCPHFHIPLQSGSEEILRRMNRPYTPASFKVLIQTIKTAIPECTIGSDVMVGFPGETDKAFEATYQFISELPLSYLHVFPYSERPGTPSQMLPDKVDAATKKIRVARLLEMSRQKRQAFFASWIGKTDTVVFEQRKDDNLWIGKSAHYLPVWVKSNQDLLGKMKEVKILSIESTRVWGIA